MASIKLHCGFELDGKYTPAGTYEGEVTTHHKGVKFTPKVGAWEFYTEVPHEKSALQNGFFDTSEMMEYRVYRDGKLVKQ
jgi:hypothetical protein